MATTGHTTITTRNGSEFALRLKRLIALERQAQAALECRGLCHECGDELGTRLASGTYEGTRVLISGAHRWFEQHGYELFFTGGSVQLFEKYEGEGEIAYDVQFTDDGNVSLVPSACQYGIPLN